MKKIIGICFLLLIAVFFGFDRYQVNKLANQFDNLLDSQFERIGIIDNKGIEHLYYRGSEDYTVITKKLFKLIDELQDRAPVLKRGEVKKGASMTFMTGTEYLNLQFGYAPELNIIQLGVYGKTGSAIITYYYINKEIAEDFFNFYSSMKVAVHG